MADIRDMMCEISRIQTLRVAPGLAARSRPESEERAEGTAVLRMAQYWLELLGHLPADVLHAAVSTCLTSPTRPAWIQPGDILDAARASSSDGAAPAWGELVARVRRRSGIPLYPEDSDDPEVGGQIRDVIVRRSPNRFRAHLPGAPEFIETVTKLDRPQRADGRWRVAGDELRQTDPQAEAVVWTCIDAAGGMLALRSAVQQAAEGQAIALDRFRIAFFGAWGRAVASEQGQTTRMLTDASRRPA